MGAVIPMGVPPIAADVLDRIFAPRPSRPPVNPAACGLYAVYRDGETNHCPGCGRTHWFIGRLTAECAFCTTAIPLQTTEAVTKPRPVAVRRSLADGWPVESK